MKQASQSTAKRPHRRHHKAAPAQRRSARRGNFGRTDAPQTGTGTDAVRKAASDWPDCLDRIHNCCRAVEMLGHLLEGQSDELLAVEAIHEAGGTLRDQMQALRDALADLEAAR